MPSLDYMLPLILIFGLMVSPTSAGILDPLVGICGALTSLTTLPKCIYQFEENINDFTTKSIEVNGRKIAEKMNERFLCCAVNQLHTCVVEKIGKICGSDAEEKAKLIVRGILNSGILATKLANKLTGDMGVPMTCDWDEWYYDQESPMCWPLKKLLYGLGMNILVLVFLSVVCCSSKVCYRSCRSKPRTIHVIIPRSTTGPLKSNSSNNRYRQLNNESDV